MRLKFVFIFIAIFAIFLVSRVYYLSIKSNEYYEKMAQQNAIKTFKFAQTRGEIFDAKGNLLAANKLGFSVFIKPHLSLKDKDKSLLNTELEELTKTFAYANKTKLYEDYVKADSYYNQDFIEVLPFVPYEEMIPHFSRLNLRENLLIKAVVKRDYPYKQIASHIIGYVGKADVKDIATSEVAKLTEFIGKSGIEQFHNELLGGDIGIRRVRVNAFNQELEELEYKQAYSRDLNLTIDIRMQEYLSELFNENSGAAIIMDTKGAIVAAASFPEYDLNSFVDGISVQDWNALNNNPDHPFINKLVNGLYPPGSVVKMGVSLAFLDSHLISPKTQYYCSGAIELGNRFFRCWNRTGHGEIDLKHAIKESCDVYFYEGGLKVGIDKISSTLSKIGFGAKTGIDLPNEFIGTVPSREWKFQKYQKPWLQGETLNTSIGQGDFLVTPMQVAKYTAQIITGKGVYPHLVEKNELDKEEIFSPFEKTQLPLIKDAMYAVANEEGGTAYRYLKNLAVKIGAKTGTAQIVGFSQAEKKRIKEEDLKYYARSHTWITSFAPYEKPEYIVTVLLEHGGKTTSVGELTAKIYEKLMEFNYLKK